MRLVQASYTGRILPPEIVLAATAKPGSTRSAKALGAHRLTPLLQGRVCPLPLRRIVSSLPEFQLLAALRCGSELGYFGKLTWQASSGKTLEVIVKDISVEKGSAQAEWHHTCCILKDDL